MRYKAIMFDMDGTLVIMDNDEFTGVYFKGICKKAAENGITDSEKLVRSIWDGTKAMVVNDGSRTNEDAFWVVFERDMDVKKEDVNDFFLEYYRNELSDVKKVMRDNPLAVEAVKTAHEKADYVVLATNPLFPMVGQRERMSWVGLKEEDFDLVTSYETENFCKPNPEYYLSICERLNIKPEECLMIGNDEGEDMYAAAKAGFSVYLVTDTSIASKEHPYTGPRGNFEEMVTMLKNLPD